MNVLESIQIDDQHSIEFGNSSWDENEQSIRRRKNNEDGIFSPHGSSELPIDGHVNISDLFVECLRRDLIPPGDLTAVINEIIASAGRQNLRISFL